jgi:flagellar motor switch protein FliM
MLLWSCKILVLANNTTFLSIMHAKPYLTAILIYLPVKYFFIFRVLMTVLFGGAGSSNAPEGKSKKKNESPENDEELNDVKTHNDGDEKRVKLVCNML